MQLQDEKKGIEQERANIEKQPKAWAALSTDPVTLRVLRRGDVQMPADVAPPGGLSAVRLRRAGSFAPPAPGSKACNADQAPDDPSFADIGIVPGDSDPIRRLKVADWIADSSNPLTWRVIVNRVWHSHFDAGLVTTPSDVGSAGSDPSHPELLDWLAHEFSRSGGRFKALHRMIVRSGTYRQAAYRKSNAAELSLGDRVDADNRLLWRSNRRRLDAETLRDSILLISGSLDPATGGASYRPFDYIDGNIPVYKPVPESPAQWRRTIYRHVIRTHREPFLDTFDCPDPSVMTPVRTQTTTPLQALSLLNNPFVIEQSRRFAERIVQESGPDVARQVRAAFQHALLADVGDTEIPPLGEFVRRHGLDGLCRVLFNTNEFLYVD
jgi:hypothetical protein